MKDNFDTALVALLKHEGGYVNHPSDPGGRTNLGVTQRVWEEWIGREATEKEMRALTPAQVGPLYRKKYWDAIKGDDLPSGVDLAVFDFAVNSGPGRAAKLLQKVLGVTQDGAIGPMTLAAAVNTDSSQLVTDYNAQRLAFLQALSHWDTFGRGWGRRVAEVTAQATNMTA
jgi:lysozyme family protein